MSSQSILTNSSDSAEIFHTLGVETTLDHVPSESTLSADQCTDSEEGESGARGEPTTEVKVGDGEDEGYSDDATEDTVGPFPKVDGLEFLESNVLVLPAIRRASALRSYRRDYEKSTGTYRRHSGVARYFSNSVSQSF